MVIIETLMVEIIILYTLYSRLAQRAHVNVAVWCLHFPSGCQIGAVFKYLSRVNVDKYSQLVI